MERRRVYEAIPPSLDVELLEMVLPLVRPPEILMPLSLTPPATLMRLSEKQPWVEVAPRFVPLEGDNEGDEKKDDGGDEDALPPWPMISPGVKVGSMRKPSQCSSESLGGLLLLP